MNVHNITFRTSVATTESEDRVKTTLSLFLFDNETSIVQSIIDLDSCLIQKLDKILRTTSNSNKKHDVVKIAHIAK